MVDILRYYFSVRFESAVRRNSLPYQFGLVASIELDVLQGILFGQSASACPYKWLFLPACLSVIVSL